MVSLALALFSAAMMNRKRVGGLRLFLARMTHNMSNRSSSWSILIDLDTGHTFYRENVARPSYGNTDKLLSHLTPPRVLQQRGSRLKRISSRVFNLHLFWQLFCIGFSR